MRKEIKRKLSAVLCLAMAVCLAACSGGGKQTDSGSITVGGQEITGDSVLGKNVSDFSVDGTVHEYRIGDTDDWLLHDGVSPYSIVTAKDATERVKTAAKDLRVFFLEATSVALPTVAAEDVSFSENARYIVIGENAVSTAAGVTPDYDVLGVQGFTVKTVGKSIFLLGATAEGSQFAAYEFLAQTVGFDYFGVDTYALDRDVRNIPLKNYDITDVPDIGIRATNYQFLMSDKTTAQRLRLTNFGDLCIPVGGKTTHNSFCYIDPDRYKDKADVWFSTDGNNLCYTARGNADEMAAMQDIVTAQIKQSFIDAPDRNIITMTHEDYQTLCECESCNRMKEHYNGSQAASIIIFLNKVCRDVSAWMETPEGAPYKRDYRVLFFAYHATNKPPVKTDGNGQIVPVDEQVELDRHLCPYFAETNADYTRSFYDRDSVNAQYADNLQGWAALGSQLFFWMYQTNFSFWLTPFNTFNTTQETYKFAVENKVDFIYDQGQSGQTGSATGFSWLKIYLYSKLTWNVDQDMNALVEKFMQHYFGPASEEMRRVFLEYKQWATYQRDYLEYTGARSIFYNVLDGALWPKRMLVGWNETIAEGMEKLQPLKSTDYNRYSVYLKNVATERIAFNYLLLKLYQTSMTAEDIALAKQQFYHDQCLANIGKEAERGGTVTQLMQNWGII